MSRKQRVAMAASSVAICAAMTAGCGALHDAPISNAKANKNVAAEEASPPVVDPKVPAKAKRTATAKAKRGKEGAVESKKAKASQGDTGSDMAPMAQAQNIPAWVTAINWAQTKLGTPYLWGGDGTAADGGRFDCSGLTKAAYAQAGIKLPRVAQDQYSATSIHPKWNDLRPGDLVFFGTRYNLHHVGLYLGSGMMIHAPRTGAKIRFNKVHYMSDYYGATRVSP